MSEAIVRKQRPKFLALHEIRLPLPGIVSILHRVSGAGLFLMMPFLLLATVGALAAVPPAIRAARTDPAQTLRAE